MEDCAICIATGAYCGHDGAPQDVPDWPSGLIWIHYLCPVCQMTVAAEQVPHDEWYSEAYGPTCDECNDALAVVATSCCDCHEPTDNPTGESWVRCQHCELYGASQGW